MIIERELILDVPPENIYQDMCDVDFFNKVLDTGRRLNIVYKQDRVISYELDIKGVGKWVSQRIMLPEKLMFITERKNPLEPFEYMIILNIYEKHGNGTKFIYKEEFKVNKNNEEKTGEIFKKISGIIDRNMKTLKEYYGI